MGGGGPTYNAPAVQKDDSFEKYLAYQQKKEGLAEERAATEKAETKAEAAARSANTSACAVGSWCAMGALWAAATTLPW